MGNRKLVATIASACSLGLLTGLGVTALISSASAASPNSKYDVVLTGAEETVPPGGDADGTGEAQVKVKGKTHVICVKFKKVTGIGPATGAHIHEAPAGVDGPIVLALNPPVQTGKKYQKSKTCDTGNHVALANDLQANPSKYYLNVHDATWPGGAIRAQLP
jgi:hypothetical protein